VSRYPDAGTEERSRTCGETQWRDGESTTQKWGPYERNDNGMEAMERVYPSWKIYSESDPAASLNTLFHNSRYDISASLALLVTWLLVNFSVPIERVQRIRVSRNAKTKLISHSSSTKYRKVINHFHTF